MNRILFFSLTLVLLIISGCSQNDSDPGNFPAASPEKFIKLPPKTDLSVENNFFVVKLINGLLGGEITLNAGYIGPDGPISINADLNIPGHSFLGIKLISYLINDDYAEVDFFPALIFNRSLSFDLKFEGLDLTGINPADVDFCYLDWSGHLHHVDYDNLVVDISSGTLEVQGAHLTHFSRYIFIR